MDKERDFTILEIFSIAIKSEIEAARLYELMKSKTDNSMLKDKFDFLIAQENKHEQILKEAYSKMFPDVDLMTPKESPVPKVTEALESDSSLKELFEIAMDAEKLAEGFYEDLAKKTTNPSSRSILHYIAKMEHSHFVLLEVEYEQLEMGAEVESDDFLRGERLMHLGP